MQETRGFPTNINLESLYHLDLSLLYKTENVSRDFHKHYLDLENIGVEDVPSSIRSWPNLAKLSMPGYKSLRMFPDVESMEESYLSVPECLRIGTQWVEEYCLQDCCHFIFQ